MGHAIENAYTRTDRLDEETTPHATLGGSTYPVLARDAMYWHLKQIDQTFHISRQAHLVRLGLSIAELG